MCLQKTIENVMENEDAHETLKELSDGNSFVIKIKFRLHISLFLVI